MHPARRIALVVLLAAGLFGAVASPAAATKIYVGQYDYMAACQSAAASITGPNGEFQDAECREAGDHWELWGTTG